MPLARCAFAALLPLLLATAPASRPVTPAAAERLRIQQLLAAVESPDAATAGEAAGRLLLRDRTMIEKAAANWPEAAAIREKEQQVADLREQARKLLPRLDKPAIGAMSAFREKLLPPTRDLSRLYEAQSETLTIMKRRPQLLVAWRRAAGANDARFPPEAERALTLDAQKVLGALADQPNAVAPFAGGALPDATKSPLAFHIACRQIETYNETLADLLNGTELSSTRLLNAYREMLGIAPLEIDARLVQAARRHSREMIELKYFSHTSPTEALREPADRMRAAGYGGYEFGENIVLHALTPEKAFELWFTSPGHHREMTQARATAVGVGRWDDAWTQCFGYAQRLMAVAPEQRARFAVKGDVLAPQDDKALQSAPGGIKRDVWIYDPFNPDPDKRRQKLE